MKAAEQASYRLGLFVWLIRQTSATGSWIGWRPSGV